MKLNLKQIAFLTLIGSFILFFEQSIAQTSPADHAKHHPPKADAVSNGPLDSLQKTLDKNAQEMGAKRKPKKKSMAKSKDAKMAMSSGGMMDMMGQMLGMMGQMSQQTPNKQMTAPSAGQSSELPGFPGKAHIYHLGAEDFFLDQSGIELSSEQNAQLNKIKDRSQESQESFGQKIKKAEEELWLLTASDRPDIKSIESKVKNIEALRGEKRITFIRDVGEAAGVLTEEQRSTLLSQKPQDPGMEDM